MSQLTSEGRCHPWLRHKRRDVRRGRPRRGSVQQCFGERHEGRGGRQPELDHDQLMAMRGRPGRCVFMVERGQRNMYTASITSKGGHISHTYTDLGGGSAAQEYGRWSAILRQLP